MNLIMKHIIRFSAKAAFLVASLVFVFCGQAQAQTMRMKPKKIPPQINWPRQKAPTPQIQQPQLESPSMPFPELPALAPPPALPVPQAVQPQVKTAPPAGPPLPVRPAVPAQPVQRALPTQAIQRTLPPRPVQRVMSAAVATPSSWDYSSFKNCFLSSGRMTRLTEGEFKEIQERKGKVLPFLAEYLKRHFDKPSAELLKAFSQVPREYFQYHYQDDRDFSKLSYEIPGRAYAIGFGSALSDYQGQAYMAQLAQLQPKDTVLEIGTGSGYNAALLSRLAGSVYSIEILKSLGKSVSRIFKPLGYDNLYTRVGDGYYGWPEVKQGFDVIIVTCAAQFLPPPLLRQLKPHGRIIIPIGQPFRGHQALYVYSKDSQGKVHCRKDMGVFFVPMKGEIQKKAGEIKGEKLFAKK
jgi:protein-L-isoaspartate(D-aspartate) O-methyltransferase